MSLMDLISFVKTELAFDHSGHDFAHAERVYQNALSIQKEEGGNLKIISAAALLHDTVDSKLFPNPLPQQEKIRALLNENSYSDGEMQEIFKIITTMSWHLKDHLQEEPSLEQKIVTDADRLEALGAIGIIRCIEYGTTRNRPFYERKNLKKDEEGHWSFGEESETDLSHFYVKLLKLEASFYTAAGKKEAHRRSEFLRAFLEEFYSELA